MYCIRWYTENRRDAKLVGDEISILAFANILEQSAIRFKVSSVSGYCLDQSSLGGGGFLYWLNKDEKLW